MRVLIIEDGFEYEETLSRFLPQVAWVRVGSGVAALELLGKDQDFHAIFLDMRFDRAPEAELLGARESIADRFNGDPVRARQFLEDHQGTFVLAALREAEVALPVLLSYDFGGEPGRWRRLQSRFGPVVYLPDNLSPEEIYAELKDTLAS